MREKFLVSERENPKMRKNMNYFGRVGSALSIVLLAVFISGCAKEVVKDQSLADPGKSTIIAETYPADLADTVVINPVVAVNFKTTADSSDVSASTLTLKEGTISVQGTVSHSGTTATFTPSADLKPSTIYTATIKTNLKSTSDDGGHSWTFTTGKGRRDNGNNALSIVSVFPLKNATSVPVTIQPIVTFKDGMSSLKIKSMKFTLKQGTTTVNGSLAFSGKTATFIPTSSLTANKVYTVTVTSGVKNGDNDQEDDEDDDQEGDDQEGDDNHQSVNTYSWNFTTGGGSIDITAPTVLSVIPVNSATLIAVNSKATVTFSETMNSTTITTANFTLKQGATTVAGTVANSGTTATFTPTSSLTANSVYTGTITTGAKDAAGNAIASNYTWSFTTAAAADVTAPTVLTVAPANSATSIAVNSNVSATFSEAMNSSTITSTTYTLKQGTTSVAGSVSYSGTTATFNPTSDLAGGKVYTATITTGAKDAAGNAITAAKTWSFTTIAVATVVSWSTQVWPIIQNKCTPCHGSSGGSAGVNMGSYAQVAAMSNSRIDNPRMYSEMGVTAAEQAIIKAWIAAGKLNN